MEKKIYEGEAAGCYSGIEQYALDISNDQEFETPLGKPLTFLDLKKGCQFGQYLKNLGLTKGAVCRNNSEEMSFELYFSLQGGDLIFKYNFESEILKVFISAETEDEIDDLERYAGEAKNKSLLGILNKAENVHRAKHLLEDLGLD